MKWGLALSGGGSWGIANGGIIEVLDSNNIKPNYISGSSMGAIIGALYALGYPPSVFTDLVNDISLWNIANFKRKTLKGGLHAGILSQNISKLLNPLIGDALIEDCKIPFVCVAGKVSNPIKWQNILLGSFTDEISETVELHVFSKQTRIVDAIMASSAIPVLFSPVEIDGDSFIDLCSFGAIPTRTLRDTYHPDIIVATKTTPT